MRELKDEISERHEVVGPLVIPREGVESHPLVCMPTSAAQPVIPREGVER